MVLLYPGKAVKKELPPIGNLSIKGIVNVGGFMEAMVLQNTRLHITYSMSTTIARALTLSLATSFTEKETISQRLCQLSQSPATNWLLEFSLILQYLNQLPKS